VNAVATQDRAALLDEAPAPAGSAPRLFQPGEVSLEELVLGAWEGLARDGRAECPVCGGPIEREVCCASCGSELY
jgi:hypothetical protein